MDPECRKCNTRDVFEFGFCRKCRKKWDRTMKPQCQACVSDVLYDNDSHCGGCKEYLKMGLDNPLICTRCERSRYPRKPDDPEQKCFRCTYKHDRYKEDCFYSIFPLLATEIRMLESERKKGSEKRFVTLFDIGYNNINIISRKSDRNRLIGKKIGFPKKTKIGQRVFLLPLND